MQSSCAVQVLLFPLVSPWPCSSLLQICCVVHTERGFVAHRNQGTQIHTCLNTRFIEQLCFAFTLHCPLLQIRDCRVRGNKVAFPCFLPENEGAVDAMCRLYLRSQCWMPPCKRSRVWT
ncbi:hypothetical protein J3E68DRAFT_404043 [Trichoderma sp. SZMC 28012]